MKKDVPVLLVDSECAVCNRAVKFIRKYLKKKEVIMFRSLFSEEGKKYLVRHGFPPDYDKTLVLIENGRAFAGSDAVLRVTRRMKGLFPLLYGFIIIPRKARDYLYMVVAKHRHRFT